MDNFVKLSFFALLLSIAFLCGGVIALNMHSQNSLQSKCSRLEGVYLDSHCVSKSVIIDLNK